MRKLLAQTVDSLPRNPRVLRVCADPNSHKGNDDFEKNVAVCGPISSEASRHPALRTERPSWRASKASTVTASGLCGAAQIHRIAQKSAARRSRSIGNGRLQEYNHPGA